MHGQGWRLNPRAGRQSREHSQRAAHSQEWKEWEKSEPTWMITSEGLCGAIPIPPKKTKWCYKQRTDRRIGEQGQGSQSFRNLSLKRVNRHCMKLMDQEILVMTLKIAALVTERTKNRNEDICKPLGTGMGRLLIFTYDFTLFFFTIDIFL